MPSSLSNLTRRVSSQSFTPYVCARCQFNQKRAVSTSYLIRMKEGREQWEQRAQDIGAGQRKSMMKILQERGYVHQVTGEPDELDQFLTRVRAGVYCGVDPTAPSLHIGHMLPFMVIFWMHLHGYHTVTLVGGHTAAIGDPTGRTTDRKPMTSTERKANIVSIHYQLKRLWTNVEKIGAKHGFHWDKYWKREIVNNGIWWNTTPFTQILKTLGRGLRLGPMLAKDAVRRKMDSGDGMSFSEFCYPILQGWDWWHMYLTKRIQVQIGGADQYGNITAGIDAIKYMAKNHPDQDVRQEDGVVPDTSAYGFTVPLLTTASGEKFGKSAGNAVWLDPQMTTIFDLYGFFVRTADADVERYLKLFTFLSLDKIQTTMQQHAVDPSKRVAQHTLALQFVELIHGTDNATNAQQQHHRMFARNKTLSISSLKAEVENEKGRLVAASNELSSSNAGIAAEPGLADVAKSQVSQLSADQLHTVLPLCLIQDRSLASVLYASGLVTSRSEGHRLAAAGGAYIGSNPDNRNTMRDAVEYVPIKVSDPSLTMKYLIRETDEEKREAGEVGLLVLRKGKRHIRIVRVVSDDKFTQLLNTGEIQEPNGYRDFISESARERAESRNAAQRLERDEADIQLLRQQYTSDTSESLDDGPEITEFDGSEPDQRGISSARRKGQRKGLSYLSQEARAAAANSSTDRRSISTAVERDAVQRVGRLRAEFGGDRRRWPPLPSQRQTAASRRESEQLALWDEGGPGGREAVDIAEDREIAGLTRSDRYAPRPQAVSPKEKAFLHRQKMKGLLNEQEQGHERMLERKRKAMDKVRQDYKAAKERNRAESATEARF